MVDAYAGLHDQFRWSVPARFNIAQACCTRWAQRALFRDRTAIIEHASAGAARCYSFAQLQEQANRLAHVLRASGVLPGDRVAVVLPQRFETAVAFMAVWQAGAVAMPLSTLFGPQALVFRLNDSGARLALTDSAGAGRLREILSECPALHQVLELGDDAATPDRLLLQRANKRFRAVRTLAEDPAVLIYTSGTTGDPKGALIPHRALIGNLTGFVCSQNWFGFDPTRLTGNHWTRDLPQGSEAVFWSPADWAWTGGLMDALLPALFFGRPIVAFNGRFQPQTAFEILQAHGVTHTFLFPTALKAMMKAYPQPRLKFRLALLGIMSAGEAVGDAVFAYCQQELGVTVNEMFGQTEINYVVGNCQRFWPARAGSMGRPYPGHRVAVIDERGRECPVGEAGDVAVHRLDVHGSPDPVFFLGYWGNEPATRAKYTADWCRTGDMATRDADGYLWYQGRADDMFKAAGYRIGPSEVENCLVKHPAVANAAVVPKPDAERGAVVKAYVVLTPEALAERQTTGSAFEGELVAQLQAHVRDRLAPYEYPKEIEFIDALPMTTTGKVQRRVLRLQEEARFAALKLEP